MKIMKIERKINRRPNLTNQNTFIYGLDWMEMYKIKDSFMHDELRNT